MRKQKVCLKSELHCLSKYDVLLEYRTTFKFAAHLKYKLEFMLKENENLGMIWAISASDGLQIVMRRTDGCAKRT